MNQDPVLSGVPAAKADYTLISPRQLYQRINQSLDEPMGLTTVYQMIKMPGFPSVKIGGRFYVMEDKVNEWLQTMMKKTKR